MTTLGTLKLEPSKDLYCQSDMEVHLFHRTLSAEEITSIFGKMVRGEMGDCDCEICTGEVKLI